jgi:hypothetical protein
MIPLHRLYHHLHLSLLRDLPSARYISGLAMVRFSYMGMRRLGWLLVWRT